MPGTTVWPLNFTVGGRVSKGAWTTEKFSRKILGALVVLLDQFAKG
jgi:hypothetical protein